MILQVNQTGTVPINIHLPSVKWHPRWKLIYIKSDWEGIAVSSHEILSGEGLRLES